MSFRQVFKTRLTDSTRNLGAWDVGKVVLSQGVRVQYSERSRDFDQSKGWKLKDPFWVPPTDSIHPFDWSPNSGPLDTRNEGRRTTTTVQKIRHRTNDRLFLLLVSQGVRLITFEMGIRNRDRLESIKSGRLRTLIKTLYFIFVWRTYLRVLPPLWPTGGDWVKKVTSLIFESFYGVNTTNLLPVTLVSLSRGNGRLTQKKSRNSKFSHSVGTRTKFL